MGCSLRDRWPFRPLFVFTALAAIIGGRILVDFPRMVDNGGGAALTMYGACLLVYAFPVLCIEVSMGHWLKGPIMLFGKVPFWQGIGWGMVSFSMIANCYQSIVVAQDAYYFYSSLPSQRQDMHSCRNQWTKVPCAPESRYQRYNLYLANSWAVEQFYDSHLDPKEHGQYRSYDPPGSLGPVNIKLLACAGICWGIVFVTLLLGPLTLGVVSFVLFLGILGLMFAMMARGLKLEGAKAGVHEIFQTDWDTAKSWSIWNDVIQMAIRDTALGTGLFLTLSGFNKRRSWRWMLLEIPFILVLLVVTGAIATIIYGSYLGHGKMFFGLGSLEEINDFFSSFDFTTMQILLSTARVKTAWYLVFYVLLFVMNISSLAVMVEITNTAILHTAANICGRNNRTKFRPLVALGTAVMYFGASVIFCTRKGTQAMRFTKTYLPVFIPVFIFCEIIAFVVWLSARIWSSRQSTCSKLSLTVFLLLPFSLILLAETAYAQYINIDQLRNRLSHSSNNGTNYWLGLIVALIPVAVALLVTILHAITTCCQARSRKEPACRTLMCGFEDELHDDDYDDDDDESFEMHRIIITKY